MAIIVQKFGGTSVADATKIHNVAKAVIKEADNGNQVVVVVSAMGHTTDYLVSLAKEESKAHIHYDEYNSLEEGSKELIIEKIQ